MDSDGTSQKIHVVVVPLPAQSHLNQLLHFSRAIAGRGVSVSFVATSTHIHQVRHRVHGWDPHKFNICFKELPMPDFPDGEPNTESTHPFPAHLSPLLDCGDLLRPDMDRLLRNICSSINNRRVVMVYDMHMGWVQTLADKYGIPAYIFLPVGAYPILWLQHKRTGTGFGTTGFSSQVPLLRCMTEEHMTFVARQKSFLGPAKGTILNTFCAIESQFINLVQQELFLTGKPVWTVGPLLPRQFLIEDQRHIELRTDSECMRWLDRQAPASVLYVSFGSVSSLSASQIRELALGLERSGLPFLWVLRISDTVHFFTEAQSDWICKFLPEGYERRTQGRGLIMRDWAPQLEVLFHKSTGGFLTHCGWNSTVESISAGVPMVAWPLHSDQFANSMLITRELKTGVEVKEWTDTEEVELVSAEEVEVAAKILMVSEEAMQMRKRAQDLRAEARNAVAEGGSSWKNLNSLLKHFVQ